MGLVTNLTYIFRPMVIIKDDINSLSIYHSLTAGAQGIHLVVGLEEEETLDEEIGVAICANPECDSSHAYRSANTYSSI